MFESVIVLLFYVLLYVTLCPILFCNYLDGEERAVGFCLVCLPGVSLLLCGSLSGCHGFVCSL